MMERKMSDEKRYKMRFRFKFIYKKCEMWFVNG